MMGRSPSKRQMGVGFPADLREKLEAAATAAGHSVAEEIRQRVERTFVDEQIDPETHKLMAAVSNLDVLVRLQTNHRSWHSHPGAHRVFRNAIVARLARLKPAGEPAFGPDDLPQHPLVAAPPDDLEAMGMGLEAIDFHTPPVDQQRLDRLRQEAIERLRQRQKEDGER
jgi:hypothetical protein